MLKHSAPASLSRGFTLIELLVVVAIIAILAGLILALIPGLTRGQKRQATQQEMQAIAHTMAEYLTDYQLFGDRADANASDFTARPFHYLSARIPHNQNMPYLELIGSMRDRARLADGQTKTDGSSVETLADPFGNAYRVVVVNASARGAGYDHSQIATIISSMGTVSDPSDDYGVAVGKDIAGTRVVQGADLP